ncbi:hypothetical protein B0H14DRAFT_3761075 [Mycena olivaceomarginata]|nr:hypothetical protein B0H14DRAFT_3761075 [Mycena olivaceomarginata]
MSLGRCKKNNTTITFSRLGSPSSSSSASAVKPDTTTVLREKTTIRQDGSILQARSMVTVSLDNEWSIPKGLTRLRTTAGKTITMMMKEVGTSERRCTVATHLQLPFHTIQRWTGSWFERRALKDMGLRIQLRHWGSDAACPVPQAALGTTSSSLTRLVSTQYTCTALACNNYESTDSCNVFGFTAIPASLSFESKCAALEFYQSLARTNDNLHYKKDKDRYHEFLRMTRQWRNIQMLKRVGRGHDMTGVSGSKEGECALLCPVCPQPGKNLPPDWKDAPEEKQFLYALFLALDANFRLKRKDVSSEEKDPGLGNGWAFYCEVLAYMQHVKRNWNQKQDRSHCVAHDAVDKPDRDACGTASLGIGAVDCARHNMKWPLAVGDLQLGERYMNMDYMFFRSVAGSDLLQFFVSYDIACQWSLHIWGHMIKYQDETLTLDGRGRFFTFLVPKFHLPAHIEACNLKYSFNLTPRVGQTDGEAPERGWANTNPLARSTKEMGPGFRRDTLDDHFNDWNHKKIIALGYTMRRKVEKAVPEMVATCLALADMNTSLSLEVVKEWTEMAEKWEADTDAPNPFETIRKDQHVASVRAELAAESAARELAGQEDADAVRGDMHITELIAMGLQLEQQQRVLASDMAATGLHPTDGQRRAMMERSSKLRRKIVAWINVQQKFFPALANIRAREDEARTRVAEVSPFPGAPAAAAEVVIKDAVFLHEYRLRVGIAAEALHDVRRYLLVQTHLYQLKDAHSRGIRENMRSADKLAALNEQTKRRQSIRWHWTLLPLPEDDVRGLPQSHFHDPERKKKQKRRKRRKKAPSKLSWIWVNRGESWDLSDNVAMNEAVRIEWAKTHARAMRWAEEVDLLE